MTGTIKEGKIISFSSQGVSDSFQIPTARATANLVGRIAMEFVEAKLKQKKVVVFSKSYCPFCSKAKEALSKFHLSPDVYEVVEIEDRSDCDEIQEYMGKKTGAKSVGFY